MKYLLPASRLPDMLILSALRAFKEIWRTLTTGSIPPHAVRVGGARFLRPTFTVPLLSMHPENQGGVYAGRLASPASRDRLLS